MAKNKKTQFDGLYQAVKDEMPGVGVAYTRKGNFSVIIRIDNPVEQYCADIDAYYKACEIYTSLLKTLGDGYALQKQDIFCKQSFHTELPENTPFLSRSYMSYFEGREYTALTSYIIITQELKRSSFYLFDKKKWGEFWNKLQKIQDILIGEKVSFHILDSREITEYLKRYLGVSFKKGKFSLNNFKHMDNHVKCGEKIIKMIDLVDIDEVLLPPQIKPFSMNKGLPVDLFSFMGTVPEAECVVYTQNIIIPNQRKENGKLNANMNRKKNFPDPANLLAAKDIENVIHDIAVENRLLVYTNFTVMIVTDNDEHHMEKAFNYLEKQFYDQGITINKNAYNQLELFINNFPGNAFSLESYSKFLCLHDAAVCFLTKERMKVSENTPLKISYTDRQGVPIFIDITGKEGELKLTQNSNFVCFGPSGSGKSFHMNSVVRQMHEQKTDVVMIDTGNSYEALCQYFKGTYISYSEENPITMNPFYINREEYNIEKQNFLKSLILLIWKGSNGAVSKLEDSIIDETIKVYYDFYFTPFQGYTEEKRKEMKELMSLQLSNESYELSEEELSERKKIADKVKKLEQLAVKGEGGEKINATTAIQRILSENGFTRAELDDPKEAKLKKIDQKIDRQIQLLEDRLKSIKVTELSFNSFYDFSIRYIPILCDTKGISFNMKEFSYLLGAFYKGGKFEKTLNKDMEGSLFDQSFIVFEIDAIKDDPILFPIVTLIIMDVFIQKMRLKSNRKALIIEEAWKAISSPMMAGYILYLYKTVRKFWGIVGVVTQEVNDIISNPTVKEAIVNNSDITILLDQSKFKERYEEIARMLGLSEVEQRKIWTINTLDNKAGRGFFKEVYIRRGNKGDVFGVEESPQSYMAYTTERIEKDALKRYLKKYGDYETAISRFCEDWIACCGEKSKAEKYARIMNRAIEIYASHYGDEKTGTKKYYEDWVYYGEHEKGVFAYRIVRDERVLKQ